MAESGPIVVELAPFVKLAIAYLGIMAGLAVLGLGFYVVASLGEAQGSVLPSPVSYYSVIGFYLVLIATSVTGLWQLVNKRRLGAYLAFGSLIISLLAPNETQIAQPALTITYWFAIPNSIIGILLLRSMKTLQ